MVLSKNDQTALVTLSGQYTAASILLVSPGPPPNSASHETDEHLVWREGAAGSHASLSSPVLGSGSPQQLPLHLLNSPSLATKRSVCAPNERALLHICPKKWESERGDAGWGPQAVFPLLIL